MPVTRVLRTLPASSAADVLVFAAWVGVFGGLTEAARSIWRQRFQHFPTGLFVEPEVLWMGPLAATSFLLAVGVLLFAVINHFDAHDPYFPPEPFSVAFTPERPRYWLEDEHVSYDDDALRDLRDAYDSALLYLDYELGRLLRGLQDRRLLDNTLIILTSDHGEEFGEHSPDLVKHARSLYPHLLHVPMVVVHPATVPAGVRVRETVSIRDIPTTVMDVLGLAAHSPFPGTSLRRFAAGTVTPAGAAEPRLAVAEHSPMGGVLPTWPIASGDMFAVIDGDLHYIVDGAGNERLFDLSTGPQQPREVTAAPTYGPAIARLRTVLDSLAPQRDGVRRAFIERVTPGAQPDS